MHCHAAVEMNRTTRTALVLAQWPLSQNRCIHGSHTVAAATIWGQYLARTSWLRGYYLRVVSIKGQHLFEEVVHAPFDCCARQENYWTQHISAPGKMRHCSMFVWVCNSSHTQLTSVLSVICYVVVLWPEPWLQMESDHCLWGCKRMFTELNLLF